MSNPQNQRPWGRAGHVEPRSMSESFRDFFASKAGRLTAVGIVALGATIASLTSTHHDDSITQIDFTERSLTTKTPLPQNVVKLNNEFTVIAPLTTEDIAGSIEQEFDISALPQDLPAEKPNMLEREAPANDERATRGNRRSLFPSLIKNHELSEREWQQRRLNHRQMDRYERFGSHDARDGGAMTGPNDDHRSKGGGLSDYTDSRNGPG